VHSGTHGTTRFHFSAGLAGEVIVNVARTAVTDVPGEPDTVQVQVPGADLIALVLDHLRDEAIGRLEEAEGDDLKRLLLGALLR